MAPFVARDVDVLVAGRPLLSGVTIELEGGGCLALRGRSGIGKTSLLRALCLLDDPAAGTLTLDGATPAQLTVPVWRRRVAYVAQRAAFVDGTLRDDLARALRYRSSLAEPDADVAAELLERVGLDADRLEHPATELSEGQQQRASLVRTLLVHPDVLLLDEPFSALDPQSVELVQSLLSQRARDGTAIVLVDHDADRAKQLCTRALDLAAYARGAGRSSDA